MFVRSTTHFSAALGEGFFPVGTSFSRLSAAVKPVFQLEPSTPLCRFFSTKIIATLSDDVRNRAGKVWLTCIGAGKTVIDPFQIVDSELDYQSFSADADGTVGIAITARTGFYSLARALDESWTSEEQALVYPTDVGLDLIPALQNQELQWTRT